VNIPGFQTLADLSGAYHSCIDETLRMESQYRDGKWTECIAVGSEAFAIDVRERLEFKLKGRKIVEKYCSCKL
jgi:hypothetical protein